jgi:spermidine synthase
VFILAESIWLHLNLIKKIMTFTRDVFPTVAYAFASTPTYPSGTIGFLICSLDKVRNLFFVSDDIHV